MPLTNLQSQILKLLASQRNPESFIAGSTPLNRNTLRYSGDIDVFHDREERVAEAALNDVKLLDNAGYAIKWLRQLPSLYSAQINSESDATRLEWVVDSDYRFFPAVRDEIFGYALHPVDLAINKAMAAVGRREVRDLVDLVTFHDNVLALGAIVWAAVDKSPGFTPEGLVAEIRRNSNFPASDWKAIRADQQIDAVNVLTRLRAALDEAEAFITRMPTAKAGLLFLEKERVVQPDPSQIDRYETHAGLRRGHWPTSSEISSAMAEHFYRTGGY